MTKNRHYYIRFIITGPIVVAFLYYMHYGGINEKACSIVRRISDVTTITLVPAASSNET